MLGGRGGICGLTKQRLTKKSPVVPGHEIIGRVAAVGEGETDWKEGDRIGGAWHGGHDGLWIWLTGIICTY